MHSLYRHIVCALRLLREFFFGAQRTEDFRGSTVLDTDFPPTRVLLPYPRNRR